MPAPRRTHLFFRRLYIYFPAAMALSKPLDLDRLLAQAALTQAGRLAVVHQFVETATTREFVPAPGRLLSMLGLYGAWDALAPVMPLLRGDACVRQRAMQYFKRSFVAHSPACHYEQADTVLRALQSQLVTAAAEVFARVPKLVVTQQ